MCEAWAAEFEAGYAAATPADRIDHGLARAGIALFRELPRTADNQALLCTGLHGANILAANPGRLADRMADLAGVDRGRVRHWLFARCVEESVGSPVLRLAAARLAPA